MLLYYFLQFNYIFLLLLYYVQYMHCILIKLIFYVTYSSNNSIIPVSYIDIPFTSIKSFCNKNSLICFSASNFTTLKYFNFSFFIGSIIYNGFSYRQSYEILSCINPEIPYYFIFLFCIFILLLFYLIL